MMLARLSRSRRGVAAVEFAVVGVSLILLTTGVVDVAIPVWLQMEVNQAVQAGAMYAAVNGYSSYNQSLTSTAMTNATGLPSGQLTASAPTTAALATSCYCPSASNSLTTATCGSACAGAANAAHYAVLTASTTYAPISPYFSFGGSTFTITATSYARLD